jgi:glycine hydroxymethyltransferase
MKQDIALFDLIRKEENRQSNGIELIASENFVSPQVLKCHWLRMTNKYAKVTPEQVLRGMRSIDNPSSCA